MQSLRRPRVWRRPFQLFVQRCVEVFVSHVHARTHSFHITPTQTNTNHASPRVRCTAHAQLLCIEYIDLAEQCLTTLCKLATDQGVAILRAVSSVVAVGPVVPIVSVPGVPGVLTAGRAERRAGLSGLLSSSSSGWE